MCPLLWIQYRVMFELMQEKNQEFLAWIQAFAEEKNATVAQISLVFAIIRVCKL